MDAEDALDEISYEQFRMWLAYFELEPVDAEAGLITSMLANVNRASKDAPVYKPTDFTAFVTPEPYVPPRTPEERWNSLKGQLNLLAAASRARREKREREREGEQQEQQTTTTSANDTTTSTSTTATPPEPLPVP